MISTAGAGAPPRGRRRPRPRSISIDIARDRDRLQLQLYSHNLALSLYSASSAWHALEIARIAACARTQVARVHVRVQRPADVHVRSIYIHVFEFGFEKHVNSIDIDRERDIAVQILKNSREISIDFSGGCNCACIDIAASSGAALQAARTGAALSRARSRVVVTIDQSIDLEFEFDRFCACVRAHMAGQLDTYLGSHRRWPPVAPYPSSSARNRPVLLCSAVSCAAAAATVCSVSATRATARRCRSVHCSTSRRSCGGGADGPGGARR